MSLQFDAVSFPFSPFATKAARELWFREKLGTAPEWAVWGLGVIFANQTEQEKADEATEEDNGIGFTGTDGNFLTSLAKQWAAKNWLSDKQMSILFKRMPKYAAQLIGELEGKAVSFVVNKKAAIAAALIAQAAPVAGVDDVDDFADVPAPVVPPSPLFSESSPLPLPSEPAPAQPDWKLYRTLLGQSNKPAVAAEYVATVNVYIDKSDAFAQDVWGTVKKMVAAGKVPSFRQAKVIAIACAKVSAGIPCGKQAAA